MTNLILSLTPEEREILKHALDKEIRLLTIKLDNGYFNKQRIEVQNNLATLRKVKNRL